MPYGPDDEPWDWDGDVPDWLIDILDLIDDYCWKAETMADILLYVDEYAPELLEDTVPPDPYMDISLGADWLGATDTEDDTYRPMWAVWIELDLSRYDALLGFYDEDLVFDDDIQEVWFSLEDARYLAGRGEYEATHLGYLFSLVVEVEAAW